MTKPITNERINNLRWRLSNRGYNLLSVAMDDMHDLLDTIDWYRKALSHAVNCETMHSDCIECIEIDQTLEL